MKLYGISNCDTCRKARRALEAAGHEVVFRDIRAEPLAAEEWRRIVDAFGEAAVNRRSTTWRGLSEAERANDPATLLARHPTLMRRPVCEDDERLTLGWDAAAQATWFD